MEDGPEQNPLQQTELRPEVLKLLPEITYDLILTHSPNGEYTRHRRHEEVSLAVTSLWNDGVILAEELMLFAYHDDGRILPRAIKTAHQYTRLQEEIWQGKYRLITDVYGFDPNSWEARTTPKEEAFWCFHSPLALHDWVRKESSKR
jgi:hypothetical protein